MTSLNSDVEVFKQDARGRVRVPGERRESLLDEFERSGVSGAQFARLAGIKYSTFAAWVSRRRKLRASQNEPSGTMEVGAVKAQHEALRWCEAVVEGACGTGVGLRKRIKKE